MSRPLIDCVGSFPQHEILGIGRTGLVIRRQETAIKLPLRWNTSSDDDVEANIESLHHEQEIYHRLGKHDGIVPCVSFSKTSTQLAYMSNGDLRAYLARGNRPTKSLQLAWFCDMARTLAYIHDQCIIVADLASRNFLLDSDLTVKFCDFTESVMFPLGGSTCIETVDDEGYSIQTDIGQLGAVMYEVVVGQRCEFDLFKDVPPEICRATWPRSENLPSTQGIWLGPVIERCWTEGAFRNAHDLLNELEWARGNEELPSLGRKSSAMHYMTVLKNYVSLRPVSTLATTLSTIAVLSMWMWRRRS